jgi:3-deoxy-D-manno-octulosonic-acid transferase
VLDADELAQQVRVLFSAPDQLHGMRESAINFAAAHRGATAKTVALIERALGQAGR